MTKFISEISSNHNGSLSRSINMIKLSADLGFDIVKFQLFKIDQLFSKEILKKSKNHRNRKKWELKEKLIPILAKECKKNKIKFCVTPFYLEAVEIIEPYVDYIKIASYELLWKDLLIKCAQTKKTIIISTGMANIEEISNALNELYFAGTARNDISILHCTSEYPAPFEEINVKIRTFIFGTFAK